MLPAYATKGRYFESWDFLPATRSKKKGRAKGGQLIGVRRSLDWSWKCEKWLAEELDLILEEAEDMGWQVMIMGDFNARTANQQVDLGDTHDVRNSEDDTINEEGRLLLKFCGDHGIKILNGMTDGDWNGKLTSINIRGASVVDYFITNDESLVSRLEVQEISNNFIK
uniref:Endonuclease/exonuclease/phosphatase domain-containing protein n=1 Tax=Strigamia maritima TaxID=126957 RepID=T1IT29_STRMM